MIAIAQSFKPALDVQAPFLDKGMYLVTRYDEALTVMKDTRFTTDNRKIGQTDWSQKRWIPSIFRAFLNSMVFVDEPDHKRLRTLVHQAFTPKRIQSMEGIIGQISDEMLDKMAKKEKPDLIADFALPLPIEIISEIMGIPPKNRPEFAELAGKLMDIISATSLWATLPLLPSALSLNNYLKKLIQLRSQDPQDDLVTALVQAEAEGDRLSEDELIAMLFLLLLAGHETTKNLLGNGTLTLLEHPSEFESLKSNMGLLDSAIEEMLRFAGPARRVAPRYALEDIDLNGFTIPKGSSVVAWINSANRDEAVFSNPHQFDIRRSPNKHVGFGMGIHYCLGAPLARLEGKVAFQRMFERFPDMALAGELSWSSNPDVQGLTSFPIALNA
jgi:cytochrome P450